MQNKPSIILASSSPRRRDLLVQIGLTDLIIDAVPVDETVPEGQLPQEAVQIFALRKARAVSSRYDEGLIIGADTVVVLDGTILGKPQNDEDAFSILSRLQGAKHRVYTGVAIIDAKYGKVEVNYECTIVEFKPMKDDEIRNYIKRETVHDKAGSYGIQGIGAAIVKRIEGDYFNVVGLPLCLLTQMLKQFGVRIL